MTCLNWLSMTASGYSFYSFLFLFLGCVMPDIKFFQTPMGRTFYEYTLPELVKALNRTAKAMDRLADILEKLEPKLSVKS